MKGRVCGAGLLMRIYVEASSPDSWRRFLEEAMASVDNKVPAVAPVRIRRTNGLRLLICLSAFLHDRQALRLLK
jgi:hypothetical protein